MKDSDLLSRAARALREANDGQRAGSGYTRARIMRQLHQKRRRRVLAWVGFSPLFALVAGSAWAQGTDSWQRVWDSVNYGIVALTHVVTAGNDVAERERDAPAVHSPAPVSSSPQSTGGPEAAPALQELPLAPELDAGAAAGEQGAGGAGATPKQKRVRKAPGAVLPDSVLLPERDPELSEFRRAHDAHYRGGTPSGAAQAYQEYLRRFPKGRFVPEARYNFGLLELKLGHVQSAKEALLPFAQGAFGGYRQAQARALLEALDNPAPAVSTSDN